VTRQKPRPSAAAQLRVSVQRSGVGREVGATVGKGVGRRLDEGWGDGRWVGPALVGGLKAVEGA